MKARNELRVLLSIKYVLVGLNLSSALIGLVSRQADDHEWTLLKMKITMNSKRKMDARSRFGIKIDMQACRYKVGYQSNGATCGRRVFFSIEFHV